MSDEIWANEAEAKKMVIKHTLNRQRNNAKVSNKNRRQKNKNKTQMCVWNNANETIVLGRNLFGCAS
jgi:hypothetical protein